MQLFSREIRRRYFPFCCTDEEYEQAVESVDLVESPIVADAVRVLRDESTQPRKFRRYVPPIREHLLYRALDRLPLREVEITTPLRDANGRPVTTLSQKLESDAVDFAVILRAGSALLDPEILPKSRIAVFGLEREEREDGPVVKEYKVKLPPNLAGRGVILDPMFASGVTSRHAIRVLRTAGVKDLTFVCVFAAVQGILRTKAQFPDLRIVCATVDPGLDGRFYIVPGCGDFGDRFYGTTSTA